jgi:cytochrome P450
MLAKGPAMASTATDVAFDRVLLTPEYLADPYPFYHELRAKAPLYFSRKLNGWVLTRYNDVTAGLCDKRLISGRRVESFTSQLPPTIQQGMRLLYDQLEKWIGNMDPPDHTRLRALVNKAFTPRMVQDLGPSIEAITDQLLNAAQSKGRMEFIHDFAYALPATVIATMLGVPPEDQGRFIAWADDLTAYTGSGRADLELSRVARRSVGELTEYFQRIVNERRLHPKNDLISSLASLEEAGDKLSEQELIAMCTFLLVAGHETTMALLANGLLALLRNPSQLWTLQAKPELAKRAVEEFLRYDSPIQHQTRVAAESFEQDGARIEKGQRVLLLLGAANRDPAQFADPDRLDIQREPNRHVAFGLGIHYCLGAPLARLEGQIAFTELLRRFPEMRVEDEILSWRVHTSNRNPLRMQVTL